MSGVRFNRRHIRRGNRRPLFKPIEHIFSKPARKIKSGQLAERCQQFLLQLITFPVPFSSATVTSP